MAVEERLADLCERTLVLDISGLSEGYSRRGVGISLRRSSGPGRTGKLADRGFGHSSCSQVLVPTATYPGRERCCAVRAAPRVSHRHFRRGLSGY